MSVSTNGQSLIPPGFRFHPTEEELLHYYLRKKVAYKKIDLDVIRDIDLNKLEPWDIQEECKIGSTPQNDWYFFSHKDKKYPTGTRTNRATSAGFWKATGRDKVIYSSSKRIGMRKTLVFYLGRAPHGQKSSWIMHEYRLDDNTFNNSQSNEIIQASSSVWVTAQEDCWVVCRVFKKKNHPKTLDCPNNSSMTVDGNTEMLHSSRDETLANIFQYMGRACKHSNNTGSSSNSNSFINNNNNINTNNMRYRRSIDTTLGNGVHEIFRPLPPLESPTTLPVLPVGCPQLEHDSSGQTRHAPIDVQVISNCADASITHQSISSNTNPTYQAQPGLSNWAALDRLVASHLNGQFESTKQLDYFNDNNLSLFPIADQDLPPFPLPSSNRLFNTSEDDNNDVGLWSFI